MKTLYSQATAANGWHGEWQEPVRRGAPTAEQCDEFVKQLERIESGEHEHELELAGNLVDVWQ